MFDERYDELVSAWNYHRDLRRRKAPLIELAASRRRLDRLRNDTNKVRRAHAPEPSELESSLLTTYCDRLGEMVFLFMADADWRGEQPQFTCVCGDPLDGPGSMVTV